ncbi:hypothetical protein BDN72DRAFT_898702 [Pluteus cervinus]|uniref:Uncharacterized protein n=1 Tax=Pluteus cervinus TaxID=181527 RepID=A0ACD3AR19_9AGAR|nr:hypothetical protein BDN72DRAFT_898702 [Pluteus cervinus]
MPLFGHKHDNKRADMAQQQQQQPDAGGRDRVPGGSYFPSGGDHPVQGYEQQPQSHPHARHGGMQPTNPSQGYGPSGAHQQGYGSGAQPTTATSGQGHTGIGSGTGGRTGNGGGGGMQGIQGRVEQGVGSMLGSEGLKQKGLQREQEAKALKSQGEDLAQAERLEGEAQRIRQKAGQAQGGDNQGYPGRSGAF